MCKTYLEKCSWHSFIHNLQCNYNKGGEGWNYEEVEHKNVNYLKTLIILKLRLNKGINYEIIS